MKIGILTFHRCINYGSYWQARCLAQALQDLGHRAVLLDAGARRVDIAEWRCALRPLRPTPVPRSDYPFYREKMRRFFRALAELPLSAPFPLDAPEQMERCDLVVVGSDEVWNPWHPWFGRYALFRGEGLRTQRLVAYAACCGNYSEEGGLPPAWAAALGRFDAVSVRNEHSRALVAARGVQPQLVADPCLLAAPPPPSGGGRHVAVYGHNFTPWFASQVRRWAAHRGLRLVSIGYRNDWAREQWLTAGPHEFADFMAAAQAVVTNFFHGCVFALRHDLPFACEHSPYRTIKVGGLLAQAGAHARCLHQGSSAAEYDEQLATPPGPAVQRRLRVLREQSLSFLEGAVAAPAPRPSLAAAWTPLATAAS